jgi:hypothetical protein
MGCRCKQRFCDANVIDIYHHGQCIHAHWRFWLLCRVEYHRLNPHLPFLPESKQRTLEELDHAFGVPTRRHISYQVGTVLPWWFRRWILFKKDEICLDLYEVADVSTSPDALFSSDKEGAVVEVKV